MARRALTFVFILLSARIHADRWEFESANNATNVQTSESSADFTRTHSLAAQPIQPSNSPSGSASISISATSSQSSSWSHSVQVTPSETTSLSASMSLSASATLSASLTPLQYTRAPYRPISNLTFAITLNGIPPSVSLASPQLIWILRADLSCWLSLISACQNMVVTSIGGKERGLATSKQAIGYHDRGNAVPIPVGTIPCGQLDQHFTLRSERNATASRLRALQGASSSVGPSTNGTQAAMTPPSRPSSSPTAGAENVSVITVVLADVTTSTPLVKANGRLVAAHEAASTGEGVDFTALFPQYSIALLTSPSGAAAGLSSAMLDGASVNVQLLSSTVNDEAAAAAAAASSGSKDDVKQIVLVASVSATTLLLALALTCTVAFIVLRQRGAGTVAPAYDVGTLDCPREAAEGKVPPKPIFHKLRIVSPAITSASNSASSAGGLSSAGSCSEGWISNGINEGSSPRVGFPPAPAPMQLPQQISTATSAQPQLHGMTSFAINQTSSIAVAATGSTPAWRGAALAIPQYNPYYASNMAALMTPSRRRTASTTSSTSSATSTYRKAAASVPVASVSTSASSASAVPCSARAAPGDDSDVACPSMLRGGPQAAIGDSLGAAVINPIPAPRVVPSTAPPGGLIVRGRARTVSNRSLITGVDLSSGSSSTSVSSGEVSAAESDAPSGGPPEHQADGSSTGTQSKPKQNAASASTAAAAAFMVASAVAGSNSSKNDEGIASLVSDAIAGDADDSKSSVLAAVASSVGAGGAVTTGVLTAFEPTLLGLQLLLLIGRQVCLQCQLLDANDAHAAAVQTRLSILLHVLEDACSSPLFGERHPLLLRSIDATMRRAHVFMICLADKRPGWKDRAQRFFSAGTVSEQLRQLDHTLQAHVADLTAALAARVGPEVGGQVTRLEGQLSRMGASLEGQMKQLGADLEAQLRSVKRAIADRSEDDSDAVGSIRSNRLDGNVTRDGDHVHVQQGLS